jgi:hypothetical protein
MPTVDLGPCECCGGGGGGGGLCPVFCDVVASVNGLTVNKTNFFVSVSEANGTIRSLQHAEQQGGTSYFAVPPWNTTPPRMSLVRSIQPDLDPNGPFCATLLTGDNAAQLIAEGDASIVYSNTRARKVTASKHRFILYREIRTVDFRPNWSAVWAWDWDSDGGLLVNEFLAGGFDSGGNVVETFPTLDLTIETKMPLACLPDGTCQELSPGESTAHPTAWNCDCCGQSTADEGCGECDNPLP